MRCKCVIKTIIDGLHLMILFEIKPFFYKLNLLDAKPRMIISNTKPCVFFRVLVSHHRLRTPSYTFWTFIVRVYEPVLGLSPEGVSSPSCYYPTQVFFLTISCNSATLLDFVQWYQAHSLITIVVFDFNHALTPMKCDVLMHMQCDGTLHVNVMSHM